jgi:methionine synthase II (cobalamin-independent)
LRGSGRKVKVQAPGPITLAAHLELANGHRAITDRGALRDLTGSLAEGVAAHRALVARRLEAEVVVQFDEPTLQAALLGRLTGVTGMTPVHPVDEAMATSLFDDCIAAVGGPVALHSCAPELPWKLLQRSRFQAISVDVATLTAADLDGIGEFVESGRTVMLGVIPVTPPHRPQSVEARPPVEELAAVAASITDRLGFSRSVLRERIGITPACGLAGATPEWARTAVELAQKVADGIETDPDSA